MTMISTIVAVSASTILYTSPFVEAFCPHSISLTPSRTQQTEASLARLSAHEQYNDEEMPFYALGANFALQVEELNLKEVLDKEEVDIVLDGFRDHLRGKTEPLEANQILMQYGNDLNELLAKRRSANAQGAKDQGKEYATKFLEDNPDAIQTESGLVFLETEVGTGASPTPESTVQVHYHGVLTADGTIIDSSIERGEPFTFKCSSAIKGWTEGLLMMKEGGKSTLVIPSDIGYGDEGSGGVIPPGATLKFDVELLKVESPAQLEEEETEILTLPDGTELRVPKGVKMRVVDQEDEEKSDKEGGNDEQWREIK